MESWILTKEELDQGGKRQNKLEKTRWAKGRGEDEMAKGGKVKGKGIAGRSSEIQKTPPQQQRQPQEVPAAVKVEILGQGAQRMRR